MTIEELYKLYLRHPSIQTDTRKLQKGDIYFALKGPSFDGNTFAEKAIADRAAYAVIDKTEFAKTEKTILVDDVLTTLQELAKHHRLQFDKEVPFIAITDSNGNLLCY